MCAVYEDITDLDRTVNAHSVKWDTNFIPKKVVLLNEKFAKYNKTLTGLSKTNGYIDAAPVDSYYGKAGYTIRAYYGDGKEQYVDSNVFYIEQVCV